MRPLYWLLLGILLIIVLLLLLCQDAGQDEAPPAAPPTADGLFPGEIRDRMWPAPIIVAVRDTSCSNDTTCPSKITDCVVKTFTVLKDTTYFLTLSYFNGDTLNPSCRACGTVNLNDVALIQNVTACPTGGPWINFGELKRGKTYTLSVCLQRCPQLAECRCGERVFADAVVSIRRVFD